MWLLTKILYAVIILKRRNNTKFILTIFCLMLFMSGYAKAQCNISEESYAKELVIDFVSNSDWSDVRIEVGLNNASVKDIKRISTSYYSYSCSRLSNSVQDRFSDYKVYFYKVNNKFLTISVLKQPNDPDEVAVGLTFLEIYSSSYTRLDGYSF